MHDLAAHCACLLSPPIPLQVCTYNRRNRYTCEGYGWLSLGGRHAPGPVVKQVRCWKPQGATKGLRTGCGKGVKTVVGYVSWPCGQVSAVLEAAWCVGADAGHACRGSQQWGVSMEGVESGSQRSHLVHGLVIKQGSTARCLKVQVHLKFGVYPLSLPC